MNYNHSMNGGFAGIRRRPLRKLKGAMRTILTIVLIECNFRDNPKYMYKGKHIPLTRGQWVVSRSKLIRLTGLTDQKIKTALANLQKLGILTKSTTGRLTNIAHLITILNPDKYLIIETEVTNVATDSSTNDQPTPNQPITDEVTNITNNDIQKMKHTDNEYSEEELQKSNMLFEEFWNKYPLKTGKKDTRTLYVKTVGIDEQLHKAVMDGLIRYIDYLAYKQGRKKKVSSYFVPAIKSPINFIRSEAWNDEYNGDLEYMVEISGAKQKDSGNDELRKMLQKNEALGTFKSFRVDYLNNLYGEDNWNIQTHYYKDKDIMKNIENDFAKKYPQEYAIIKEGPAEDVEVGHFPRPGAY